MGGSNWSNDLYTHVVSEREKATGAVFSYDKDVRTGRAEKKAHPTLDPKGISVRESRDSEAHPESVAVCVFFDVTGSMRQIPQQLQKRLPDLMRTLLDKKYCKDPQILMGAVGDYYSDSVPLQVGQFESGVEMETNLSNIYLEGGGGGTFQESYQNALYFAARKTSMDCWEKRGKKGYLFIIGDEHTYDVIPPKELADVFGDTDKDQNFDGSVYTNKLVHEVKEKFHVFFIIPGGASHSNDPTLRGYWENLLGPENVIFLETPRLICETIGCTIGIIESSLSIDKVVSDHTSNHATETAMRNALARVKSSDASISAVPGEGESRTTRL